MAFQGESSFLQNTQLQLKAYPPFSTTKGKDLLLHPVSELKKKQDNLILHQRKPAIFSNAAVHPLTTVAPKL